MKENQNSNVWTQHVIFEFYNCILYCILY